MRSPYAAPVRGVYRLVTAANLGLVRLVDVRRAPERTAADRAEVAERVTIANGTQIAGHVTIHDHASLSGLVAVHQFVTIGAFV